MLKGLVLGTFGILFGIGKYPTIFIPSQNRIYMLVLSLFFALAMIQIGKDIVDQGISVYQSPRFWVQILSMMFLVYITVV